MSNSQYKLNYIINSMEAMVNHYTKAYEFHNSQLSKENITDTDKEYHGSKVTTYYNFIGEMKHLLQETKLYDEIKQYD